MIICKKCGEEKLHHAKGMCKKCCDKEWAIVNPEANRRKARRWYNKNKGKPYKKPSPREKQIWGEDEIRNYYYKQRYGLTLSEYNTLLEAQGDRCAICGKMPEENGRRLSVDHNHKTGQIRGLLCQNCNRGLGSFKDNPEITASATDYLNSSLKIYLS